MKKKSETAQKPAPTKGPPSKTALPAVTTASEAQRLAATILEVLGGVRSPPQAAQVLAVSLPRYYQLEARALEGLVAALAPRPKGKQPALENRIQALEKQLEAAVRQCARQEALVRVTQRTLGLAPPVAKASSAPRDAAGRKKRRPTVRASKAARILQTRAQETAQGEDAGQRDARSLQHAAPSDGAEEVRPCSA